MQPHVSQLPLETLSRLAQEAGRHAEVEASQADITVTGWKDGKIHYYPLYSLSRETLPLLIHPKKLV